MTCDPRLLEARNWYESAYEWRVVSYAMHTQAILNAHADGKILFYVPAVDKAAARLTKAEMDELRSEPNISTSAKLPGILPLFVGMEVILAESFLPPKYVRGTAAKVAGIEPHPREPEIKGRESISSQGCVVLRYMPKCVYVRVANSSHVFLVKNDGASQPADLQGVLAVRPVSRSWSCKLSTRQNAMHATRTQVPLLPQKQTTLHGVQGKTADPGFIVHWSLPPRLKKEQVWLAIYVSLSRPRRFSSMLSHGLPDRKIIEAGPPAGIVQAFEELFDTKIAATQIACKDARQKLAWPARR